jgi:hypothetical protein
MPPPPQDHHNGTTTRASQAPTAGPPGPEICPFCGGEQRTPNRCEQCGAHTDPLSRQATQNEMGPWFIRDEARPFRPGCRFETLERLIRAGKVGPDTVIRGPGSNQNWMRADRVPGVARLLGRCHACASVVDPAELICRACGAGLDILRDRQHLGLSPVRQLPGRADPASVAAALLRGPEPLPAAPLPGPTPSPISPAPPGPSADPAPTGDPARRLATLERRLRWARRRTAIASAAAAGLGLALTLVLIGGRLGAGRADLASTEQPVPAAPDSGEPDLATPGAADARTLETTAPGPADPAGPSESATALVAELERALLAGGEAAADEAERLLDGAPPGVLSPEEVARWRGRIAALREAEERARVP